MDILEEDVEKKPKYAKEYAHHSWKFEATIFEQQFARKLYDRDVVREAGQTALSRVSTLLVRYNRLKRLENQIQEDYGDSESENERIHDDRMKAIEKERADAEKMAEGDKKTRILQAIAQEEKQAEAAYQQAKAEIEEKKKMDRAEVLKTGIDDDSDGRVRASLMLGGTAEGGRGYNLTDGSLLDTMKAGQYISEASGEKGTLLDQMSLLDNAVNTAGVDIGGDQAIDFNRAMSGLKQEDVEQMNLGSGAELKVDMDTLGKLQKAVEPAEEEKPAPKEEPKDVPVVKEEPVGQVKPAGKPDGKVEPVKPGEQEKPADQEDTEAKKEPEKKKENPMGIFGLKGEKADLDDELFESRESEEAQDRREGDNFFKRKFRNFRDRILKPGTDMTPTSFLGDFGAIKQRVEREGGIMRALTTKSESERRQNDFDDAAAFFEDIGIDIKGKYEMGYADPFMKTFHDKTIDQMTMKKSAEEIKVNKNDSSKILDEKITDKDLDAAFELEKAGFLKSSGDGKLEAPEGDQEDAAKKMSGDKSARNMMRAFKLLGATQDQLVKFRLALMAYMIPTGRKTVYDIIQEGIEGEVAADGIDMSEPGLMYETLVKSTSALLGGDITEAPKDPKEEAKKAKEAEKKRKQEEKERKKREKEAAKKKEEPKKKTGEIDIDDEDLGPLAEDFEGDVIVDVVPDPNAPQEEQPEQPAQEAPKEEAVKEEPKRDLRLPMEVVKEYILQEWMNNPKRPRSNSVSNFRPAVKKPAAPAIGGEGEVAAVRRKRSASFSAGMPVTPVSRAPLKPLEIGQPAQPLAPDQAEKAKAAKDLKKYTGVFSDISSQAGEIFGEGGEAEAARRLSEKLRASVASDEKKAALKSMVAGMIKSTGATDGEEFWAYFMESFGDNYLRQTVGKTEDSKYSENTGLCIAFLRDNDSDLKTLILEIYTQEKERLAAQQ